MYIKPSNLEGDHKITKVIPVKYNQLRFILIVFLSIITFLLVTLILRWKYKFYYSFIYLKCSHDQTTHYLIQSQDNIDTICQRTIINGRSIFTFRFIKYIHSEQDEDSFEVLEFSLDNLTNQQILEYYQDGLEEDIEYKQQIYGKCKIEIPQMSFLAFIFDMLTNPFYMLQLFSIFLLSVEGLAIFAVAIVCGSTLSNIIVYQLQKSSLRKLQILANNLTEVQVIRHKQNKIIKSEDLVPGDIIYITKDQMIPCDILLLSQEIMVNEASLTGESVPVPKQSINADDQLYSPKNINCFYEGTKCVQVNNQPLGLVIRIGFQTIKGQYFRNVLFPKKIENPFQMNALKFILGLAILIISILIVYTILCANMGYSFYLLFFRWLFYIIWIFPPQIPIAISINGAISLLKLNSKGVVGRNIEKIQIAGKVDTICFDKTGTLTELGLITKGVKYQEKFETEANLVMACCHHLINIDGLLQGDMLDLQMFRYSKAKIDFQSNFKADIQLNDQLFHILQINDFNSEKAMMSVIIKKSDTEEILVLAKGAPEKLKRLCINIPANYDQELEKLTLDGYRVIALAFKVGDKEIQDDCDSDLHFCGFLYFENPLKEDTKDVIDQLLYAKLDLKIVSGDNPLTTLQCGKVCGIIEEDKKIIVFDFNEENVN